MELDEITWKINAGRRKQKSKFSLDRSNIYRWWKKRRI
jgi:hypothetical protein